ncbi:hypothetical protein KDD30_05980 [Photobacterium sp. GJ3]|uniref:DUF7079 family protein n=1 Tax=Photobacterium sp. GJ3 TaxID=2829502 RepID=UPI001B8B68CC|nr:hypothetical protein [Photobacterium sp. GJ3]QUJ68656.1 hypothetical protein KDD30_05980 [Photobacterium sp. GJ3]
MWVAFSHLFLDADVAENYPWIVRTCVASPYAVETLKSILFDEVSPALYQNVLSVAGEWAGFDENWLVARIVQIKSAPYASVCRILNLRLQWFHRSYLRKHWHEIEIRILRETSHSNARVNVRGKQQ